MKAIRIVTYIPVEKQKRTGRESTTPPHGTTIVWRCDEKLAEDLDEVAKLYGLSRSMIIGNAMRAIVDKMLTGSVEDDSV